MKSLLFHFLSVWVLGIPNLAYCDNDLKIQETAVVKIQSSFTDGHGEVFRGSGLIFRRGTQFFVLTSEHVIHQRTGVRAFDLESAVRAKA